MALPLGPSSRTAASSEPASKSLPSNPQASHRSGSIAEQAIGSIAMRNGQELLREPPRPGGEPLADGADPELEKGAVVAVIDEIRAAHARFNDVLASGSATDIASWYTEAARLLADGTPRIDGRAAIEGFFAQAIEAGFSGLRLETDEVIEAGDLVI